MTLGLGAPAVRAAQIEAEACAEYEDEWTEELLRAQPAAALAALLASSGTAAAYPLRFGVSSEECVGRPLDLSVLAAISDRGWLSLPPPLLFASAPASFP